MLYGLTRESGIDAAAEVARRTVQLLNVTLLAQQLEKMLVLYASRD
jgi:hypothetical protein